MGQVYKARQVGLERIVALKVLFPGVQHDRDSLVRFEREGRALSAMSHPNIPLFYHFGVVGDSFTYIAMEFLEGNSLLDLFLEGPIAWRRLVPIIIQVADALEHAHRNGFVHRDLKPNNIMLVESPERLQAKVVDFGLAGLLSGMQTGSLTQSGQLIGSLNYMSPELCRGLKPDERADVYALGCILYEGLAGRPPFSADTPIGIIHKHATAVAEPLMELLPENSLPVELDDIVAKAMSKDCHSRYQRAAELRDALARLASQEVTPGGTRRHRKRTRPPIRATVILISSVLLCASVALAGVSRLSQSSAWSTSKKTVERSAVKPVSASAMIRRCLEALFAYNVKEAAILVERVLGSRSCPPPDCTLCLAHILRAKVVYDANVPFSKDEKKPRAVAAIRRDCLAAVSFGSRENGGHYRPVAQALLILAELADSHAERVALLSDARKILAEEPWFANDVELQVLTCRDTEYLVVTAQMVCFDDEGPAGLHRREKLVKEMAALYPERIQWQCELATTYDRLGQHERALSLLRELHRRSPDELVVTNRLFDCLSQCGREKEVSTTLAEMENQCDHEIALAQNALKDEKFADGNFVRFAFSAGAGGRRTVIERAIRDTYLVLFDLGRGEIMRGHSVNGLRLLRKSAVRDEKPIPRGLLIATVKQLRPMLEPSLRPQADEFMQELESQREALRAAQLRE